MQVTEDRKRLISEELQKYGIAANDTALAAVVAIMQERNCQYPQACKIFAANSSGATANSGKRSQQTNQSSLNWQLSGVAVPDSVLERFSDQISDKLYKPVSDRAMAKTLLKSAQEFNAVMNGESEPGDLTKQALALIFGEYDEVSSELSVLESTDPKYSLPESSSFRHFSDDNSNDNNNSNGKATV